MFSNKICTLFIFYLIKAVNSLHCYVCDEKYDPNCVNPSSTTYLRECPFDKLSRPPTSCATLVSSFGPFYKIKRGCFYGNISFRANFAFQEEGCMEDDTNYKPQKCIFCYTNQCNNKIPFMYKPKSCYICDERLDSDCRSNLKPKFLEICAPKAINYEYKNPTGCYTLTSKSNSYFTNVSNKIKRGCYYGETFGNHTPNWGEGCDDYEFSFNAINCQTCQENYCNDEIYPVPYSHECYICDENVDRFCRNTLNSSHVKVCPDMEKWYNNEKIYLKAIGCLTILANSTIDSSSRVIRQCLYNINQSPIPNDSCGINYPHYRIDECKICTGRKCNNIPIAPQLVRPYNPLKCYVCDERRSGEQNCRNNVQPKFLRECPEKVKPRRPLGGYVSVNATGCSTLVISRTDSNKDFKVIRDCSYEKQNIKYPSIEFHKECRVDDPSYTGRLCRFCYADQCNSNSV